MCKFCCCNSSLAISFFDLMLSEFFIRWVWYKKNQGPEVTPASNLSFDRDSPQSGWGPSLSSWLSGAIHLKQPSCLGATSPLDEMRFFLTIGRIKSVESSSKVSQHSLHVFTYETCMSISDTFFQCFVCCIQALFILVIIYYVYLFLY